MKPKYKKYLMIGGIVVLLLIIGFFIFSRSNVNREEIVDIEPTEEVLPTVDASVKVEFKLLKKGEALLMVSNEPNGTNSIEFELSYSVINTDTSEGGGETVDQGAIGKCYRISKTWECGESSGGGGRKIILGTCSSGVCRYHNVVGKVKVVLKFTGDYGQKIFEKEYKI